MPTISEIPKESIENLDSKKFYQNYLSKSKPLLVTDGCKNWKAVEKWGDMDYLKQEFGGQSILINRLDKGKIDPSAPFTTANMISRRNNFADFLNKTENQTNYG
jgi:hypothetical protein